MSRNGNLWNVHNWKDSESLSSQQWLMSASGPEYFCGKGFFMTHLFHLSGPPYIWHTIIFYSVRRFLALNSYWLMYKKAPVHWCNLVSLERIVKCFFLTPDWPQMDTQPPRRIHTWRGFLSRTQFPVALTLVEAIDSIHVLALSFSNYSCGNAAPTRY